MPPANSSPPLSVRRVLLVATPFVVAMLAWAGLSSLPTGVSTVPPDAIQLDQEPDVAPLAAAPTSPAAPPSAGNVTVAAANVSTLPSPVTPEPLSTATHSAVTPAEVSADWPGPYGPDHDSCSRETGLRFDWNEAGPTIAWEAPIGLGYNIPAIVGQTLFAWSRYGDVERLEARDLDTGELRWNREFPASYVSPYDYSAGPHASPVVNEGVIYTLGAAGEARAHKAADGELIWERNLRRDYDLPETPYSLGATPLVTDGFVILQLPGKASRAGLVALDAASGETVWTATDHGLSYAMPRRIPNREPAGVIALTTFGLLHVDLWTGRVVDQFKFGVGESRERVNAVAPIIVGDRVYGVAGPGPGTVALSIQPSGKFELVWRNRRLLDSQYTSVLWRDGHLYGFNSLWNGTCELRCIDTAEAKQVWSLETDLRRGQLIYADGRLIALGEQGHLGVIDLRRVDQGNHPSAEPPPHRVTTEPVLKGACYSAPALAHGRLVLRNEGRLVVIDCR